MGVPVADLKFNIDDITNLARKLSTLQPYLTQQEYKLLLAIFAAAAARAEVVDVPTSSSTLPEAEVVGQKREALVGGVTAEALQNQLLNAYIPGSYFNEVTVLRSKVTGGEIPGAQAGNPAPDEGGQPRT